MKEERKPKKYKRKKRIRNSGDRAFGQYLEKLISEKFDSIEEFAVVAECTPVYLSNVIHGKISPTLTSLKKFARALKRDKKDMLDYDDNES